MLRRTNRAFTLLELIVTLVILALLATIAVPTFSRVIDRAESETARTEVSALLRNAMALTALTPEGTLDYDILAQSAAEITLGESDQAEEGITSWSVVNVPAPSSRYGQVSFEAKDDVRSVAMLSRSGECVMGRVEGTSAPQTWITKSDLCIADVNALPGESPEGGGTDDTDVVDDPTKPPVSDFNLVAGDARVTLNWTAVEGATGYTIFRDGVVLLAVPGGTSITYEDNTVTNGVTYIYTVAAYDTRGNWEKAAPKEAKPMPPVPDTPDAPAVAFEANHLKDYDKREMVVSGRPVPRALAYQVFVDGVLRGVTSEPAMKIIGVDVNHNYQVSIAAQNLSGLSAHSDITEALAEQDVPPAPEVSLANTWSNAVQVRWEPSSGANGYRVFSGDIMIGVVSADARAAVINKLNPSTGYLVRVYAFNSSGVSEPGSVLATTAGPDEAVLPDGGDNSETGDAPVFGGGSSTVPGETPGVDPTEAYQLRVQPGSYSNALSWKAYPKADKYQIFRDGAEISSVPDLNFTDIGLTPKTTYRYYVVAYTEGKPHAPSKTVQVTTKDANLLELPDAPDSVSAAPGDAKASVVWAPSERASQYRVYVDGVLSRTLSSNSAEVVSLTNGKTYRISVSAVNSAGESGTSEAVSVTPQAPSANSGPTPSKPTGLAGTVSDSQVSLTWDATPNAKTYQVYRNGVLVRQTSDASTTVPGSPGESDLWSVLALNPSGRSPRSDELSLLNPTAAPQLKAVRGNASASFEWLQNGKATHWTLYRDGMLVDTYTDKQALVQGLANGTSYNFHLVAHSKSGASANSNTINVVPVGTPPTPSSLSGTLLSGDVSLSWRANASSASVPTTSYALYRNGVLVYQGPTPTNVDKTAPRNSSVGYQVEARGPGGSSARSAAVNVNTPPTAPGNLKAVLTGGGVGLTWGTSDGATSYSLRRDGVQIYAGPNTSFSDLNASAGSENTYQVAALKGSALSALSAPTKILVLPAAPPLSLTGGYELVEASWGHVPSATGYRLYRSEVGKSGFITIYVGGARSFKDLTVRNGTAYEYWVSASNAAGEGAASAPVQVMPSVMPPNPPATASVTTNSTTWVPTVRWTAPASGSTVKGYQIWKGDLLVGVTASTVLSFATTPLEPGETATFSVTASGDGGQSGHKLANAVSRPGAPVAPAGIKAEGFNSTIDVSWEAVKTATLAPVTGYNIYVDGVKRMTTTGTSASVENLSNGVSYAISVSTYGTAGESAPSAPIMAKPGGAWSKNFTPTSSSTYDNTQGILEWYGETAGGGTWVNPTSNGVIPGGSRVAKLFDRNPATYDNGITIDLGAGMRLKPTAVLISQAYGSVTVYARDDQGNNFLLTRTNGEPSNVDIVLPISSNRSFRYFYTVGGTAELELYGSLRTASGAVAPSAPTLQSITPAEDGSTLNWVSPGQNGGTPALSYRIYADGVFFKEVPGGASLSQKVKVPAGANKSFSVSAVTLLGESPQSNAMKVANIIPLATRERPASPTATDPQGIFDWIGIQSGGGTWVNPAASKAITASNASTVDHVYTSSNGIPTFDLGPGMVLKPSGFWNANNLQVLGSLDGKTWDTFTREEAVVINTDKLYRFFKFPSSAGEFEIYGTLYATAEASKGTTAPTISQTEDLGERLGLKWEALGSSGNLPVTGYKVYVDDVLTASISGSITPVAIVPAKAGERKISVTAVNLFGEGPRVPITINMKTPIAQLPMNDFTTEDYAGIFSWFGKKTGGGAWVNPLTAGILKDVSGVNAGFMREVVDRNLSTEMIYSNASVDFGPDYKIAITGAWAQSRFQGASVISGSNDNKTWESLGFATVNTAAPALITDPNWSAPTIPKAYRYIKINRLTEIELYGAIIPTN